MTVLTYFFKHNTSDEHPFHLNTSAHTGVAQRQYQETIAQTKTSSNGLLRNNTLLGWGLSTSAWHLVAFPGHYVWLLCRDWPPKARGVTTVDFGVSNTSGIREGSWRRATELFSCTYCSVAHSCLTLCDTMDCGPPVSSVLEFST